MPPTHDFGLHGGTPISNISTILSDVDHVLGINHPPAVEYIYIEPYSSWSVRFFGVAFNPYGHTALRWTLPNGTQKLVNITSPMSGHPMVEIISPSEYLFGTNKWHDQGGVYNRSMVSVRIEHLPDANIIALDRYITDFISHTRENKVKYSVLIRWLLEHGVLQESGNCAWWISKGLMAAGLLSHPIMFPKAIWVSLFEDQKLRSLSHGDRSQQGWLAEKGKGFISRFISRPKQEDHHDTEPQHNSILQWLVGSKPCIAKSNVHVVAYKEVGHAHRTYGFRHSGPTLLAGLAPGTIMDDLAYWDLGAFADALVHVPRDTRTALVDRRVPHTTPLFARARHCMSQHPHATAVGIGVGIGVGWWVMRRVRK